MRTDAIYSPRTLQQQPNTLEPKQSVQSDFKSFVASAIGEVNKLQLEADEAAVKLATGEARDLHEVMLVTEKANIALQLTVQVRNKALEAYQEIMRMQV